MWEGVGDWTELQHIDPHSSGDNSVSFLFVLGYSSGGLEAQPLWDGFSFQHLLSNSSDLQLTDFLSSPGSYNNLTPTLLPASITISHSFKPSTVKVIISWYSSTGCTCYQHRCISYFDSLAGLEVNMQQSLPLSIDLKRFCKQKHVEKMWWLQRAQITIVYSQNFMLDDNTICSSLSHV